MKPPNPFLSSPIPNYQNCVIENLLLTSQDNLRARLRNDWVGVKHESNWQGDPKQRGQERWSLLQSRVQERRRDKYYYFCFLFFRGADRGTDQWFSTFPVLPPTKHSLIKTKKKPNSSNGIYYYPCQYLKNCQEILLSNLAYFCGFLVLPNPLWGSHIFVGTDGVRL